LEFFATGKYTAPFEKSKSLRLTPFRDKPPQLLISASNDLLLLSGGS
jgi:hypothetical protein